MKNKENTHGETIREEESKPLEIIEMPIKITRIPAVLAPFYEKLNTQHQFIVRRQLLNGALLPDKE